MIDAHGNEVSPEFVLDEEELADYYRAAGYRWWEDDRDERMIGWGR